MTVSSSSEAAATAHPSSATTHSTTASTARTAAANAITGAQPTLPNVCANDSSSSAQESSTLQMRTFAVIVCNDCLYLEFPGCDVHGVLYTDRVAVSESKDKDKDKDSANRLQLHAKCPECTAATNNVRPFRDGCRRCKGATTVSMWASTLDEIALAHDAFPAHTEEVEHTALVCDACQSVVFPRAREVLTRRSATDLLLTQHDKLLQVANFQLSMPHVDGCVRRGMPITAVPIQLPKSELKFVLDRIAKCPLSRRIESSTQYRKRHVETLTQQNHLHQIYLRLLTSVVKAFDSQSPAAVAPLEKVLALFATMEPLALFADWSPPRQLSRVVVVPTRVLSSSDYDADHSAHRILETGTSSFWRSAPPTPQQPRDEWLNIQFSTSVALSAITLRWHLDFVPARFAISLSADGTTFETVAIVVDSAVECRVALAKHHGRTVSAIKIALLTTSSSSQTFGLRAIACHEAMYDDLYTPPDVLLRALQHWLLEAAVSPSRDVRELALQALQQLALASGSLCGLLQLATGLLVNDSLTSSAAQHGRLDARAYNEMDALSDTAQQSAGRFLYQLTRSIEGFVADKDSSAVGTAAAASDAPLCDETSATVDATPHPNAVHPFAGAATAQTSSLESDGVCPFVTLSVAQPAFLQCIKRRSQLGMVLLYIVSELSAWQMKRMQRAEELAGKREAELLQLEEPFSIEVGPEFFDLAHRVLSVVLAPWLSTTGSSSNSSDALSPARLTTDALDDDEAKASAADGDAVDLYTLLQQSFTAMRADVANESNALRRIPSHDVEQLFSPDGLCVALLQTITSNIRRLVLSRVDPSDVGVEPVRGDFPSAPPALESIVSVLEQLIALGAKRSDRFFAVSLKAAAAVEVGMEAFYPSAQQRTKLLTARMGNGATLEVQVRWPVQERDQEDPRYERLVLMLQLECIRLGLAHAIRGRWHLFMHLVVQVPATESTERVLTRHFAGCIQRAGFAAWQVVAGAQELAINLQRHLHWNRVEKMSHDSGAGWIRVYPRDVAGYDDVLADVERFLAAHDQRDAVKRSVSSSGALSTSSSP